MDLPSYFSDFLSAIRPPIHKKKITRRGTRLCEND